MTEKSSKDGISRRDFVQCDLTRSSDQDRCNMTAETLLVSIDFLGF